MKKSDCVLFKLPTTYTVDALERIAVLDANPFSSKDNRISIIIAARSREKEPHYFVLDAWAAKSAPDKAAAVLADMAAKYNVACICAMETTLEVFRAMMPREIPCVPIPRNLPPAARIKAFVPVFHAGNITLNESLCPEFWSAMRYPDTAYVGLVVAFADAISMLAGGVVAARAATTPHPRASAKHLKEF